MHDSEIATFGSFPTAIRCSLSKARGYTLFYWHFRRYNAPDIIGLVGLRVIQRLTLAHPDMPALESAHAVAYAERLAATLPRDGIVLANLSGRGDKDAVRFALERAREESPA